jgi:hypothetical protein
VGPLVSKATEEAIESAPKPTEPMHPTMGPARFTPKTPRLRFEPGREIGDAELRRGGSWEEKVNPIDKAYMGLMSSATDSVEETRDILKRGKAVKEADPQFWNDRVTAGVPVAKIIKEYEELHRT